MADSLEEKEDEGFQGEAYKTYSRISEQQPSLGQAFWSL